MAPTTLKKYLALAIIFSSFANFCSCTNMKSKFTFQVFRPTIATWYGSPNGAGTTGGACAFEDLVQKAPYSSMVAAGGPSIYQGGQGCGACYRIKCTENPSCSGNPVTITITDECPGCSPFQFDFSGLAFGSLAKPGHADQLRNAGKINVQYRRVPCNYPRTSIMFKVDKGANPFWFAAAILYENGDGDIASAQAKIAGSNHWSRMTRVLGATFSFNPQGIKGPYSIRLITGKSKKVIVAKNVIPGDWNAGSSYNSDVNFFFLFTEI